MQVIIYSTTTCPYCKKLKDYLSSKQIGFTEKLVDIDDGAEKEMGEVSGGFLGVPFTLIIKDDGSRDTVLGFDQGKIDSILKISQ